MKNCPFCGGPARVYCNHNGTDGLYAQGRCKSKACKARGPLVATPRSPLSWGEAHALPTLDARKAEQDKRWAAAESFVKREAERAWNERAQ